MLATGRILGCVAPRPYASMGLCRSSTSQSLNPQKLVDQHPSAHIIKSEFPPVPVANVPFYETVLEAIKKHSRELPKNQSALVSAEDSSKRISYEGLLTQCYSIATYLESIGFGYGDIAGAVLPNSWEYLIIFIASAMRGGAISGSNCTFTSNEIGQQLTDSSATIVFTSTQCLERVKDAASRCPKLKKIVLVPQPQDDLSSISKECPEGTQLVYFPDLASMKPDEDRMVGQRAIAAERDLLLLPYSSGTTGPPKGVMLTHKSFGTMMNIFSEHYDKQVLERMDPEYNWRGSPQALTLPFYHIYGIGLAFSCLISGRCGIVMRQFDPQLFCKTIEDYKLKHVSIVPPIIVFLAKSPVAAKYNLSSLRFIMSGAAPLGHVLVDEVRRRLPSLKQVAQGYGMTEESMATHLPVFGMDNPSSAGKLGANLEMKIAAVETRQALPLGEIGEICVRGPTIMKGYLNRPEATAECIDAEGWLYTGDVGYQDPEGWTYVVDRLKELVKVKGFQVAPAELEDLLLSHPDIKDAAVIGVSDPRSGEVPKAFVVKRKPELTETEVADYIKDKAAPFKHLKGGVEFLEEIPKSPSGKILRRELRLKEAERRQR